jgi:hypothetical protein
MEEVRPRMIEIVRGAKQDSIVELTLNAARAKANVKVNLELLSRGAPAEGADSTAVPAQPIVTVLLYPISDTLLPG